MRNFWKLLREEKAATAIEYGMIVAFIAIAATAGIMSVAKNTNGMWSGISQNVSNNM